MKFIAFLLAAAATSLAADTPRIVSGGGAITEIIYALGAQGGLAAVDVSSVYPGEAAKLAQIGYARQLSAEGILSLRPSLLLVNDDAGPPETLSQVEGAGVKVLRLSNGHTPAAAAERIKAVGEALGHTEEAERLIASLRSDLDSVKLQVEQTSSRPKVLFIYTRGGGVMNVAGRTTAADSIIALAGGMNAVQGYEGYKPLTAEAAVTAAPDFIMVTSRGLQSAGGLDELLKQPGLSLTPAAQAKNVIVMDDLYLLGFGPRLGKAALELYGKLHPSVQLTRQ